MLLIVQQSIFFFSVLSMEISLYCIREVAIDSNKSNSRKRCSRGTTPFMSDATAHLLVTPQSIVFLPEICGSNVDVVMLLVAQQSMFFCSVLAMEIALYCMRIVTQEKAMSMSVEVVLIQKTEARRSYDTRDLRPVLKSSCAHSKQRLEDKLTCALLRSGYHVVSYVRMKRICQRVGRDAVPF